MDETKSMKYLFKNFDKLNSERNNNVENKYPLFTGKFYLNSKPTSNNSVYSLTESSEPSLSSTTCSVDNNIDSLGETNHYVCSINYFDYTIYEFDSTPQLKFVERRVGSYAHIREKRATEKYKKETKTI